MKLTPWLTNLFSDSKKLDKRIREIFFNLIQNNQGSITELDLAIAANISGKDAKKYLEQFAVEFDATFEVTEKGHIVYLFPIRNQTEQKSNFKSSQNNLSIPKEKHETADISENVKQNSAKTNQKKQKSVSSSPKTQQNYDTKINYQVADINKNLKNVENDIKDNLKNVENDLKNIGDSLNNLFKS
ncbi:conserved hypothetical protein [Hyella patelloides LEGE 07179]|uniref:Uncharacterized protein n=1 Tax=Hyella patelloides LEGE 07179 TaxID=945734 RepID=A0A563VLM4_9CYAN|nr:hypothetical protein [Hyella patelloides]VEP12318.1 conserved hypothetical protein [Hyella patelloides LEGE 07179]